MATATSKTSTGPSGIATSASLTKAAATPGLTAQQSANLSALAKSTASGSNTVNFDTGSQKYNYNISTGQGVPTTQSITPKDVTAPTPDIPVFTQPKFDAIGNLVGSQAATDYYTNVTSQQENVDKRANDTTQMYKDLFASIATPEQNLASAKAASGMDAAQKLANEENAKLQAIIKQGQANQLSVVGQGRGIPEAIIGGQQAQFARETAIAALPVQASLEAAQGNLAAATATFDKLFQAKQQDAQNRLQYGVKMIDTISQFASEKDKIALDYVKQQEQRKYDATIKEQDRLSTLSTTLLTYKAPSSLLQKVANAKTYKEAISIPGISQYMTDPLDARIKAATARKLEYEAGGKQNPNSLLSIKDAKDAGVPYGTTYGELIAQGKQGGKDLPIVIERGLDKIDQLNKLITPSVALATSAGTLRGSNNPWLFGNKINDWRANAKNVLDKLTVDELGRVKVDGVTFGQLSNGERLAVGNAASALNAAMVYSGTGEDKIATGKFKMSEQEVINQFNIIKKYAELDFYRKTGMTPETYKTNKYLDTVDNAITNTSGAYGVYNDVNNE
jgi:hypothetical protein